MDHVFISINQSLDRISEISGIRTSGRVGYINKSDVISAFTSYIHEDELEKILKALKEKLNTEENEKFVVVTANTELLRAMLRKSETTIFSNRIWVDISQIAWPLRFNGMIKSCTISALAKHFNIELRDKSDTADECTAMIQIYGKLMQRYKTALIGEEIIRDVGGDTLENIRKMIGF